MSCRQSVKIAEHDSKTLEIPIKDVCRYLGLASSAPTPDLINTIEQSIDEFRKAAVFRACYKIVACSATADGTQLGDIFAPGSSLAKNLLGCTQAIIFAATAGIQTDLQRKRMEVISPARALILDAIGTAAIESFCSKLCSQWQTEFNGRYLRPRFSPGYGDLPLELQRPLLDSLEATQHAGISLTNALLMLPQKSVSAIVGIGEAGCTQIVHDCFLCSKTDCEFRL